MSSASISRQLLTPRWTTPSFASRQARQERCQSTEKTKDRPERYAPWYLPTLADPRQGLNLPLAPSAGRALPDRAYDGADITGRAAKGADRAEITGSAARAQSAGLYGRA